MKIRKLEVLNILIEMAGAMLNHRVDDEFYDYYMLKELNWLIENRNKIINDYVNNYDKLKFDFENNYFNYINKFDVREIKKIIEEMLNE